MPHSVVSNIGHGDWRDRAKDTERGVWLPAYLDAECQRFCVRVAEIVVCTPTVRPWLHVK